MERKRTIVFISDGTGITAEALGHSLLTQFEGVRFKLVRMPFINDEDKVDAAVLQINEYAEQDGIRPIVFSTLVNSRLSERVQASQSFYVPFFHSFLGPLEQELGIQSSHTVGRSHSSIDNSTYQKRIDAINYTLAHDDGVTDLDLEKADVILVGVSRCGKTPTSLYLAMQFGVRAANFPLIPEDFERTKLPGSLERHRSKLFGLTIQPARLAQVREERRAASHYASLENCQYEVREAERMMRREGIRWLDSSTKSIEEISTTILQEVNIDRGAP